MAVHWLPAEVHRLNIERETANLVGKDVRRMLAYPECEIAFTLHDGVKGSRAAHDVV